MSHQPTSPAYPSYDGAVPRLGAPPAPPRDEIAMDMERLVSRPGLLERTPLRVKLVLAVVALSAVVLIIFGLVVTAVLRTYLADQVERRLKDATDSFAAQIQERLDAFGGPPRQVFVPPGYLVQIRNSSGRILLQNDLDERPDLPRLDAAGVADLTGDSFSAEPATGSSEWRVRVVAMRNGDSVVVATSLADVGATVRQLVVVQLAIGGVALVVMSGLGSYLVRRSLRPLNEIEQVAEDIAAGDLGRRVPEPDERTEVGRLAGALNGMLGRIESAVRDREAAASNAQQSEQRMRRFIADASHELRTPLTSIRGFAELTRQGAVPPGAEAARVMSRIENEATRMNVLVDDLLALARLDQSRPLAAKPVDLVPLAVDAAYDARAVAPDRAIHVDTAGHAHAVVRGDEVRLRQVIGNLVSNALTHTPAGTPVDIRVRSERGAVVLEVVDQGPGLSAEQAARVFERFYRVDAARSRAAGGSGLGLAIVQAIAAAHGGRVEVDSRPGSGATFRLRLPAVHMSTDPA